MVRTKIIATIGPTSFSYGIMKKLVLAGADIFRINTKYGTQKEYALILHNIQKINKNLHTKIEVLFDIKKVKIISWLKNQEFEYLAVAFAEDKKQINLIKQKLGKKKIKIISKIETKKGIMNLEALINVSFGIMVARGDLGDNVPIEKLPIFQKEIIAKCNKRKKFVVTATEMLLSMQYSKEPERAEVTDIANAVLDGSTALMLSEETAIGKYPAEAVTMMNKIIKETEKWQTR